MSRIGSMPITLPNAVSVDICGDHINVSGVKGSVSVLLHLGLECVVNGRVVSLRCISASSSVYGTCRSNINNAVLGVSSGVIRELNIVGVGYKAEIVDKFLILYLGYSHDIRLKIPAGMSVSCPKPDRIIIEGCDLQRVSSFADLLSRIRKYNPYKGKGVLIKRDRGGFLLRKEANKKK